MPTLKTAVAVPLQVRVGIATGLVVVGDLIGAGTAQEQTVVGETPNLAARLQALGEPGAVVIAASTRRLISGLFEYRDPGTVSVKGFGAPVQVWQVTGASAVDSRFEALRASGVTELVGREEELGLLLRRWSQARAGDRQVVLLSGEAGIGKARLTAALLERLASGPHTRLRNFCSPQHTGSALYPIIGQMERSAGFAYNDTVQTKLDKLDALLTQTSTSIEDAGLLAGVFSIATARRASPLCEPHYVGRSAQGQGDLPLPAPQKQLP